MNITRWKETELQFRKSLGMNGKPGENILRWWNASLSKSERQTCHDGIKMSLNEWEFTHGNLTEHSFTGEQSSDWTKIYTSYSNRFPILINPKIHIFQDFCKSTLYIMHQNSRNFYFFRWFTSWNSSQLLYINSYYSSSLLHLFN